MSANWLTLAAKDGRAKALSIWLCLLVAAPLTGQLPAMVRLQFSVTAMIAMLFLLWENNRTSMPALGEDAAGITPTSARMSPRSASRRMARVQSAGPTNGC
jgi:hypothetical protein